MAENASALVRIQVDAAELGALHACNSIVLREALVQEGITRVQKLAHGPVPAQDVIEEQGRLGLHSVAQLGAPVGELLRIGLHHVEVAQLQPLAGEIGGDRGGAVVTQHAFDLRVEHVAGVQLAGLGECEQLVIGH